jgi:hypothetical protein
MGDIALRGNRLTFAKGGRAGFQKGRRVGHKRTGNTQRENRLEELGRVDSERAWTKHGKRDLRLEKHRIRDELKKGGKPWGTGPKPGTIEFLQHHTQTPKRKGKAIGGVAKIAKTVKKFATEHHKKKKLAEDTKKGKFPETESLTHQVGPYVGDVGSEKRVKKAKGGKADKKWIQKAVNPKHKGYCTPMTKKTCTPARKALARTFKKKAKTGW